MKAVTKTEAACDELRRAILSGTLEAGRRLPVSELMGFLDMSPTPIREALRLLQATGLVVHEAHRGMVVRRPSVMEDEDISDLRLALEPLAAAKAAAKGTDEQLNEIRKRSDRWRELVNRRPAAKVACDRVTAAHRDLQYAVFEASNSAHVIDFVRRLWESSPSVQLVPLVNESIEDQSRVIDAILERDPVRARSATIDLLTRRGNALAAAPVCV